MTNVSAKGKQGAAPGDIPTDLTGRAGSLTGSMNASGHVPLHTFWKLTILHSQG